MTVTREAPERLRTVAKKPRLRRLRKDESVRVLLRALAAASVVVLAMRITLPQGVQVGYIVAAALLPLWIGLLRRYRFGWTVMVFGLLALGSGVWLQMAGSGTRATDPGVMTSQNVLLIGSLLSVGLILWARTVLEPSSLALWFGIGLILSINPSGALFDSNPWKFGFYLPVAVVTLALARMSRRWWVELAVLLALTGISAISDARSAFGLLLLAAVLVLAQLPVFRAGHKGSALLVFLGAVVLAVVVAAVGQAAILGGYLGSATQARSLAQIQTSGSLILGGRPELSATLALMRENPWGFGAGVAPSDGDLAVAKAGMTAIGYDPNNNYVEVYMFGGHFELHSVVGDIWTQSGILGLAFIAAVLIALLWSVSRRIADGKGSGVVLFLVATSIWLTMFGPWQSTAPYLMIAIGLVAVPIARPGRDSSTAASDGLRSVAQPRENSTTVSTGPLQRTFSRSPAASSRASSDAEADAG